MGGNLLKHWNLPEKRVPTSEYERIKEELLNKFQQDFSCNRPCQLRNLVAPSIRDKETHGDLDIIIGKFEDPSIKMYYGGEEDYSVYLEREFGHKPFKNGNVYSFPYDGFQVDVSFYSSDSVSMAVDYSSWGDLGNIMGRIYHKMGLHFGHTGLSFWIRQELFEKDSELDGNSHIYDKIVLTNRISEICEIGGFDYEKWQQGFDTEKEAFDFVVESKYFNPEFFQLENLNHTNRTRNRKRGMYMRFMEHVDNGGFSKKESLKSKDEYLLILQCKYPHLQRAIDGFRFLYEIRKAVSKKINGQLVMQWFNLTKKDGEIVGKIMREIKTLGDYELLKMSQFAIISKATEIYKQFKYHAHARKN
jgi:hypothetical protein